MLRHLGQPLERDPDRIHPRKGEVDPEDSVFVVFIYPENGAPDQTTPQLASIWLSKSEATVAAERYVKEGHPSFEKGLMSAITVVEFETGKMKPMAARHGDPLVPPPPPVVVDPNEDPVKRMERLEIELAEIRIKLGIGVSTTTVGPGVAA